MSGSDIEYFSRRAEAEAHRALDRSVPAAAAVHASLAILYSARAFMLRADLGLLDDELGKMVA